MGEGFHADLAYMARNLEERKDAALYKPWAKSLVLLALAQNARFDGAAAGGGFTYRIAAYARGRDYHGLAREILREVEAGLGGLPGAPLRFHGFVDTEPVFERDYAAEAGLGWRGKNACLIDRRGGSGFLLCGFFLDRELPATAPQRDFCGACTLCLEACPTGALKAPGTLDASACISYWTIEAKGAVPEALSSSFGSWIFGCDICQAVCPWNRKHLRKPGPERSSPEERELREAEAKFDRTGPEWLALLRKGGGFRSAFKGTPLLRAGRRALLRNLAIAARNLKDTGTLEGWRRVLGEEEDEALLAEIRRTVTLLENLERREKDPA